MTEQELREEITRRDEIISTLNTELMKQTRINCMNSERKLELFAEIEALNNRLDKIQQICENNCELDKE